MDLSSRTTPAAATEIFAKIDDIVNTTGVKLSRSQRKKAKSENGSDGKHGAGKTTAGGGDEPTRRKKHLSHKKDPISHNEQRRTVFVGNLPNSTDHKALERHFATLCDGEVESARLRCIRLAPLADGEKNRGRGVRILRGEIDKSENATATAYIVFKDVAGADKAVAASGTVYRGRHLSITSESPEGKAFAPRSSVYLGNMPYDVTDEAVWTFFIDNGLADVSRVRVVRDATTGKSKGFGYVEFASRESVVKALKMRGAQLANRPVRIFSVQQSRDPKLNAGKMKRRDKRQQQHQQQQQQPNAAAAAGKKKEKTKTSKAPKGDGEDSTPSWMGMAVDPRKKLSKELRWLSAHPNDRKAAAKNRHKDRVRATFIKKKKDAKSE